MNPQKILHLPLADMKAIAQLIVWLHRDLTFRSAGGKRIRNFRWCACANLQFCADEAFYRYARP